ncbi:hypothetical protein Tco_0644375, partial [Tanacetum coccineum]
MDKIRLSRAQILWGMFYKKNIDYVYLLWEEILFQIEYKDAKKTNKMSYPKFTKIIIDYFMAKDQSISRRKKIFWHTARDDTIENSKPKYVRKKADFDTSTKQKPVQATKGTKIKSKAKVSKSDKKKQPAKKPKSKGLAVLSEVALTKAEQLKLATKRSKKYFHISHASGSGDGIDTQSKVPDEQQQKTSGIDEGTSTILGVPDVPIYEYESEKESWGDSDEEDDDEDDFDDDSDDNDESDDERMKSDRDEIPDPNKTNEEHNEEEEYDDEFNIKEEEKIDDEESMD